MAILSFEENNYRSCEKCFCKHFDFKDIIKTNSEYIFVPLEKIINLRVFKNLLICVRCEGKNPQNTLRNLTAGYAVFRSFFGLSDLARFERFSRIRNNDIRKFSIFFICLLFYVFINFVFSILIIFLIFCPLTVHSKCK